MAAGARFKCVLLLVRDVPAAARFYEAALRLPVVALSDEYAELVTGGTPITLKLAPRCVRVYLCGCTLRACVARIARCVVPCVPARRERTAGRVLAARRRRRQGIHHLSRSMWTILMRR